MKLWLTAALVALSVPALAQEIGKAGEPVPAIPFDSVPNFFKLPPDMNLGILNDVVLSTTGPVALRHPLVSTQLDLPSLDGVSHLLLQLETPIDAVTAYAAAARRAGVAVVLNAAWRLHRDAG